MFNSSSRSNWCILERRYQPTPNQPGIVTFRSHEGARSPVACVITKYHPRKGDDKTAEKCSYDKQIWYEARIHIVKLDAHGKPKLPPSRPYKNKNKQIAAGRLSSQGENLLSPEAPCTARGCRRVRPIHSAKEWRRFRGQGEPYVIYRGMRRRPWTWGEGREEGEMAEVMYKFLFFYPS